MDNQIFQAICVRVADEKDPQILERFKKRLRLLLQEEPVQTFPEQAAEHRWGLDY
jgi:hypothetical protein